MERSYLLYHRSTSLEKSTVRDCHKKFNLSDIRAHINEIILTHVNGQECVKHLLTNE